MITFGIVGVVRARGAKPRGFGNGRKDRSEAENVIAFVAFVAKKQLGWGFAGTTFLANDVVEVGEFFGSWFWSLCSSSAQCC